MLPSSRIFLIFFLLSQNTFSTSSAKFILYDLIIPYTSTTLTPTTSLSTSKHCHLSLMSPTHYVLTRLDQELFMPGTHDELKPPAYQKNHNSNLFSQRAPREKKNCKTTPSSGLKLNYSKTKTSREYPVLPDKQNYLP